MRREYLAGLTLLLLATALTLPAEDGRDFAGFYRLGEISVGTFWVSPCAEGGGLQPAVLLA